MIDLRKGIRIPLLSLAWEPPLRWVSKSPSMNFWRVPCFQLHNVCDQNISSPYSFPSTTYIPRICLERPFYQTGGVLTGLSQKSDDILSSIQNGLLAHQMVLQSAVHMKFSYVMRVLENSADNSNIPWNLHTIFHPGLTAKVLWMFFPSPCVLPALQKNIWLGTVRRWSTVIARKIFTSFAKFRWIVSFNHFPTGSRNFRKLFPVSCDDFVLHGKACDRWVAKSCTITAYLWLFRDSHVSAKSPCNFGLRAHFAISVFWKMNKYIARPWSHFGWRFWNQLLLLRPGQKLIRPPNFQWTPIATLADLATGLSVLICHPHLRRDYATGLSVLSFVSFYVFFSIVSA